MNLKTVCFIIAAFISGGTIKASDVLKINLQQADSLFQANNYNLLASSMNIEAQKAMVLQTKLFQNPVLTTSLHVYDTDTKKLFQIGPSGEKTFQLDELIRLGGKRKSEIEMAKGDVKMAELEFQQLVRQLKFQLHSDLFALGQQKFLLDTYNKQLVLLDTILNSYQIQTDKGNIPLKELVRLKGAYLKLNNDRSELFRQYYETLANVQTLLQVTTPIEFQFSEDEISRYIKVKSLDELKQVALANRPELLIAEQEKLQLQQNLQYQKKLAIPDVGLFTSYDQHGGVFNHEFNAGINIGLPFFNRNQGNIKASQFRLNETDYHLKALNVEITTSLQNYYSFYNQTVAEYQKATKLYNQDFEITIKGMEENFQKRNVSIIEFVDFFEAYNDALTELSKVKTQLVLSGEQLNMLTGKDLY
jgi:cobalt-zinc-cadmium efflux system outer membrane protein